MPTTTMRFPVPERLLHRLEDDHAEVAQLMPVLASLSGWAANHEPDDGVASGGTGAGRSSDTTSTTERAALAGRDTATADLEAAIADAIEGYAHLRNAADRIARYVTPRTKPAKGRVSTLDVCPVCDREMGAGTKVPAKAGFCEADYKRWCRDGRPDRAWFVRRRRGELAEEAEREKASAKASKAGRDKRIGKGAA